MFGMGDRGTTNLITRALAAVGRRLESVPDPTQIHYRLPKSEAHPEVRPATTAGGKVAVSGIICRFVIPARPAVLDSSVLEEVRLRL